MLNKQKPTGKKRLQGSAVDPVEFARVQRGLSEAKKELETLYAALDNVESGLLVLNKDMRAVYSNPVLHVMFKANSSQEIRETKPLYADMLATSAEAMAVNLEDYVSRRLAWVRSGDAKPMDLAMTDGTVLRCHLAILPGGGRMLIYSDVTDIVRNAEELERLATTDGMTGIYNRRHFLTLADSEWARARRYGRPVSFLMIDIDSFKLINDNFGHQVGDEMIVHLASLARDCKRECDVLARIGGEEFALLLPETELPQAQIIAERLRSEVAANPLVVASRSIPATISIGVATSAAVLTDISDLMKAADQALYDAKRDGRNRVICCVSSDSMPSIAAQCPGNSREAAGIE
jgi:diguanylate cyclase (GGDEF)-like protein